MLGTQNSTSDESRERVDDVMLAVGAYADMVAMLCGMAQGNPVIPVITSQWISVLLLKLREWGALSDLQYDQLMHRIQADVAARQALHEKAQKGTPETDADIAIGDDVQALLNQLGI